MARQYYKDSTTGQMKPIGVKVEDTLPVDTIIDYAGTDIPEGWEKVDNEVVLYQGQGNTNTLTLNDAIENYTEIQVKYNLGDMYEIKRFQVKSNAQYSIAVYWGAGGNTMVMSTKRFIISGTTLTVESNRTVEMEFKTTGNTLSGYNGDVSRMPITEIIGYKEV